MKLHYNNYQRKYSANDNIIHSLSLALKHVGTNELLSSSQTELPGRLFNRLAANQPTRNIKLISTISRDSSTRLEILPN